MKRLLPLRVTDGHDEINMFALEDAYINNSITGNSYGDEGVFVKITSGDLNLSAPVVYGDNSYLGKTNYPHVFDNVYPSNPRRIAPASSGDTVNFLGITLEQTAMYDENGEKLLSNSVKRAENTVVMPGESVKVLRRGIIQLSKYCIDGTLTLGGGIKLSATSGKVTGCTLADSARIGFVLMTGQRTQAGDLYSGFNALVEFGY